LLSKHSVTLIKLKADRGTYSISDMESCSQQIPITSEI
jgi:hypothetical protein